MLGAVAGAFVTIYLSLIETLARLTCFVDRKKRRREMQNDDIEQNNTEADKRNQFYLNNMYILNKGVSFFGTLILYFSTLLSISLSIWVIAACFILDIDSNIIVDSIVSQLWSFLQWFIWSLPFFCWYYKSDKKNFLKEKEEDEKYLKEKK